MRSSFALTALAILGNFDVALAGPCKPHVTSATVTTTAPTTSETKGPVVVKNVIGNGNFAVRDPTNPSNIPSYTVQGDGQIVENKGYTGDGSKEKGCVQMQASNQPPARKRAIGNIVSISQQLDALDTKKKYTIRFFYAVITASSINVCTLSASIAGHVFYTSTILSIGAAMDWNTVLEQTDVPNTEGAFSIAVNCPVGGIAAIYVDSIFMSNQVTPETIDDVSIDFGDEGSSATTSASLVVSTASEGPSSAANTDGPSTETEPSTESRVFTSEAAHPTSGFFTSSDVNTFSPSTISETGAESSTATQTDVHTAGVPTASQPAAEGPSTMSAPATQQPSTSSEPATESPSTASDSVSHGSSEVQTGATTADVPTASEPSTQGPSTESENNVPTLTLNPSTEAVHPTTASEFSTASSLPTGSRVCPVGAPPPGYCTPVQPEVTQLVSLPGIPQESENDRPTAPRACWAFGDVKSGTWGRTKDSVPRQNSIEDCALLCKQEGSACKAFAWDEQWSPSPCRLTSDTLGVVGIDLNKPSSLMWNDFDCFECHDCDVRNPADIETTSVAPSTASPPEITSAAPPVATACPHCHLQSSPSSDLVCEEIGNLGSVDLEPYANNEFDKATMQTSSEQCATICFILQDCAASAYDYARRRCIFTNTEISSSEFQEAQDQNPSAYILPWSSKGCWSCSNDCSTKDETTSHALSSTEHTVEQTTMTPTRTEPLTTFISSYAATTTYSSMPECTLALSDGCQFDQNNFEDSQCSKYGTMRNTFTLKDGEYDWQLLNINTYQNCPAICNQMGGRCKSSAWDQNLQQCVFSSRSVFSSSFTSSSDDSSLNWSDQSCYLCFCHDYERDDYSASLRTSLPTATCAPSITSEDAVCQLRQVDDGNVVCQHTGYFQWSWDEAPSKFPNQDSEERCAALCNSNPDCMSSGWSEEYGKCALSGFQLKGIQWQQFGSTQLSWSDKGCWDCSDCIKSQKWRNYN